MALNFIFVLMFLESDNVSSSEASATRVDIMDGVRNFRPRQVRTVEKGLLFLVQRIACRSLADEGKQC